MRVNAIPVSQTRVEMAQVMTPNDANFLGKVFGGSLLSMIDLVAYATASKFAGATCVTASIDRVDFIQPIEVGEIVTMVGHVGFVGRTSVEVSIDVFAENIYMRLRRQTNTARVTMVALRDNKPAEVPRLVCETRDDKVRFLEGRTRRLRRQHQRQEFDAILKRFSEASDEELDELMLDESRTV